MVVLYGFGTDIVVLLLLWFVVVVCCCGLLADLGLSEIQMTACFDVLRSPTHNGINYQDFTSALQNRRDSIII